MVLGDYLDCEVVVEYVDVGVGAYGLDEAFLDFKTGVVGVVEDAEFRVATLAVEVKRAVVLFVEVHAPANQLAYLVGGALHHLLDGGGIGQPVAGHHGVVDVFVEVVYGEVCHRCHAALGQGGVGLFEGCLANQRHAALAGHLKRETHAGYARANHEIIVFVGHCRKIMLQM